MYNTAKSSLETTINNILFPYYNKINSQLTSEDTIIKLKEYKNKLDLELITQEEYNKEKEKLSKFIK